MAYNFLRGDRDQPFLLPPTCAAGCPKATSPGSSSTWSTGSTLRRSLRCCRADGHGHPAYDPKTLLAVLLYA
jgi:hypothetical protein